MPTTSMLRPTLLVLALSVATCGGGAAAAWNARSCGREPQPPAVDGSSVARYNDSIDRVGAYQKAARGFSACVNQQASLDQTAISNDARARMGAINTAASAVQRRIAGNFVALSAQLRASGQKLGAR